MRVPRSSDCESAPWEFTRIGGLLRAGEGGECMMPAVEGLRENRTEEGTPYVVGDHVDWGVRAGERRDCSRQALEAEGPE